MVHNVFDFAARPIGQFCRPAARVLSTRLGTSAAQVLKLCRNRREALVAVRDIEDARWVGYLRAIDLMLGDAESVVDVKPLVELRANDSLIHAAIHMQSAKQEIAHVLDDKGRSVGLLFADDVVDLLILNRAPTFLSTQGRRR
jgi:CBS domain containing-hemolysin-like protein